MKLHKFDIRYRKHLANQRRVAEIEELLKDRPLIKLDEPVTVGWNIIYELKEEIRRRKDAFDLQQVLDLGYGWSWTKKIKHVKMIRQGIEGYEYIDFKKVKRWHSFHPPKSHIDEKEYTSLSVAVKKYFYLDTLSESYRKFGRKYYLADLPKHFLTLRCRPIIHTHYQSKGGKLEKERDFLKDQISEYWRYAEGFSYSSSYPAYKDRAKTRDKIQKFKKGEIEDIEIEKIPKEYDY